MSAVIRKSKDDVARLKQEFGHPVIDGDGHIIESFGMLVSYVEKIGGKSTAEEFVREMRQNHPISSTGDAERGDQRGAWWGVTNRAEDLATVMAPGLLSDRLEEIGIDFAILYPTLGLGLPTMPHDELRQVACRALNTMNSELTAEYRDRMTPVASIPMHTPDEAIAELHHCTQELGMKVAMVPAGVARPWPAYPEAFPAACFMDRYGLDSHFDYDPVWQCFVDNKVAVTAHGGVGLRYMECGHRSPTNYMYNHILGHAFQQSELAKSLVMGGVPRRFPTLKFAFLEGGAGWAADLLHSLEEHWEKRNSEGLRNYDPSALDRQKLAELLQKHGIRSKGGQFARDERQPWVRDEFEESLIESEDQIRDMFAEQFFFGCEADDRSVYRALDGKGNPFGIKLNAVFSSDIGHWDVPDISQVLFESRGLVDAGLLTEDDYAAFVYRNPVYLHAGMNPDFFKGTKVAEAARKLA
ncbi:MAG TPA: amidohydrolase family protein [Gammaproteobacteria bacterium]|nr:amidohydrolase family protein [Gammaproteobacteria bacterium]